MLPVLTLSQSAKEAAAGGRTDLVRAPAPADVGRRRGVTGVGGGMSGGFGVCRVDRRLESPRMSERNTVVRSLHDLGLARWFGGSLAGVVGFNGAAADVPDEKLRLRVANAAWARSGEPPNAPRC